MASRSKVLAYLICLSAVLTSIWPLNQVSVMPHREIGLVDKLVLVAVALGLEARVGAHGDADGGRHGNADVEVLLDSGLDGAGTGQSDDSRVMHGRRGSHRSRPRRRTKMRATCVYFRDGFAGARTGTLRELEVNLGVASEADVLREEGAGGDVVRLELGIFTRGIGWDARDRSG